LKKTIDPSRVVILAVLLLIILSIYFVFLYKLQVVEGDNYLEKSENSVATLQTVTAARGNILDRYGRVLVSNNPSYNILINENELFNEQDDPNATIIQLTSFITARGGTFTDTLPITKEPPFEYTEMTSAQESCLKAYLKDKKLDEDIKAVELMSYMRKRYNIDDSYTAAQTRIIAGIRYEINSRYSANFNTASYVFVENASKDLVTSILEAKLPVVSVETSFVREYSTTFAAQLLGYTGAITSSEYESYQSQGYSMNAKVGKDGVEKAFESYLHGTDGQARVTATSEGTVTNMTYTKDPVPGNNVYLTIDLSLQEAAEKALASGIESLRITRAEDAAKDGIEISDENGNRITGGAVCVVDVDTGEPLAIASYPTFDLSTMAENFAELAKDKDAPMYNRALMGTYAPGSTFKPCTAIAGLSEGVISTTTEITCSGVFTKYADAGYAPVCWIYSSLRLNHGNDNVTEAIRDSCNIFFYTVGDELGIDRLGKYAKEFGLGQSTGIELSEKTGNLASKETHEGTWYSGDNVQAAIGQSDHLFTPLQLSEYCAAVANSGTRHTASILKMVRSYDYSETIYQREAEVLSTIEANAVSWNAVHEGMRLVASDPDGSAYSTFGYYQIPVGAKTGTSQIGAGSNNGAFICYAPYDNPKIAIAVIVEHAGAGASLAPIAKDILDAYFGAQTALENTENELELLK